MRFYGNFLLIYGMTKINSLFLIAYLLEQKHFICVENFICGFIISLVYQVEWVKIQAKVSHIVDKSFKAFFRDFR